MADVSAELKDWSIIPSSNQPADATTIGAGMADNFQQIQATVRAALAHKGSDLNSAATIDLGANTGFYHDIAGATGPITSFGTVGAGIWKILQFDSTPTITHNATSMILPGGTSFTVGAKSHLMAMSLGAGNWVVPWYTSASGGSLNTRWTFEDFGAVGDGVTDDSAAFALAMTGIGSANAEIRGSAGKTYLIGASGISIANKTSVRIVGNGAKIKLNAVATPTLATFGSTAISLDTCTNVEFSGWDIDGNSKASNIIGLEDCTDCTISNNRTNSGGLNGHIVSAGGIRNSYLFNRISSGSGTARGMWIGNTNTIEPETDPLIMGNVIRNMNATGIGGCHLGGRIIGNHCVSNAGAGIVTSGDNATGIIGHSLVINGNICNSNTFHGIQMGDISGWASSADSNYDISINGNHCEGNTGSGVYIVQTRNSSISFNVCVNNGDNGVSLDKAIDIVVSSNICYDSRSAGSRTQDSGIYAVAQTAALDVTRVTITGNVCYNHVADGIQVNTAGSGTMSSVVVSSNVCNANSSDGIHVGGSGASLTRVNVTGNVCSGNTTSDLRVDPQDAVISDNLYTVSAQVVFFDFTDADTTPSVLGARKQFRAVNTGATSITMLDDGVWGQEISIFAANGNTTLVHGSGLILKGATNTNIPSDGIIAMRFYNTIWREVSRSY